MANKKIQDFGEKIGGARKDLWRERGLMLSDLVPMNEAERSKYVKRDNIWPRPDWKEMLASGENQAILYWKNEMRKAFPPAPRIRESEIGNKEAILKSQQAYVEFCAQYRDAVMAVGSKEEIQNFAKDFILKEGYIVNNGTRDYYGRLTPAIAEKAANCLTQDMMNLSTLSDYSLGRLEKEAEKNLFAIPNDQRELAAVRASLIPIQYDGNSVVINEDRYDVPIGVQIVVNYGGGSMFFYDREHQKKDFELGKYLLVDKKNNRVVERNLKDLQTAKAYIEVAAALAQSEANKAKREKPQTATTRKKSFPLQKLESYERIGLDYLGGRDSSSDDFLKNLGFRAGEFGNWVGDGERQKHMNLAYNSLYDLAAVLGVAPESVSFEGQLALAFGARGNGNGAAHYEPMRKVINLTRTSGAGRLAHEWGHALDNYLAQKCGLDSTDLLSDTRCLTEEQKKLVPPAFRELVDMLKTKSVTETITVEDAQKNRDEAVACDMRLLGYALKPHTPRMTSEQKEQWDKLVDNIKNCDLEVDGEPQASIAELSNFRKSVCGHVLPKQTRDEIMRIVFNIDYHKNMPVETKTLTRKENTDFYEGSKVFDELYSKDGFGYWQSSCEMFARAFDCYVEDKLKEVGLKSPYLSSAASTFSETVNGVVWRAYPVGEERAALNAKFDEVMRQIKEMGLLREAVVARPEISVEKSEPPVIAPPVEAELAKAADEGKKREEPKPVASDRVEVKETLPAVSDRVEAKEASPAASVRVEVKGKAPAAALLQSEKTAVSEKPGKTNEFPEQAKSLPASSQKAFRESGAVRAVAPRNMTVKQAAEWNRAASEVLDERTSDALQALSATRQKIVGREIPGINLKQIMRVAREIAEEAARNKAIEEAIGLNDERKRPAPEREASARQMSMSDYVR